ncbi:MAG: hypothetical protein AAF591_10680 [Verrucomicrobiota bacterium]
MQHRPTTISIISLLLSLLPLASISQFSSNWGRRILVLLFTNLGLIMIADAIGFYLGTLLIPTGSG